MDADIVNFGKTMYTISTVASASPPRKSHERVDDNGAPTAFKLLGTGKHGVEATRVPSGRCPPRRGMVARLDRPWPADTAPGVGKSVGNRHTWERCDPL